MSLINYVEPVSLLGLFQGIGTLLFACVLSYIIWRIYIKFIQWIDIILHREMKYEIIEETYLDKIGQAKGIDLNKELMKREVLKDKKPKNIRKKIEEQIYNDLFKEKNKE